MRWAEIPVGQLLSTLACQCSVNLRILRMYAQHLELILEELTHPQDVHCVCVKKSPIGLWCRPSGKALVEKVDPEDRSARSLKLQDSHMKKFDRGKRVRSLITIVSSGLEATAAGECEVL
jgi:hypothetical protein